MIGQTSRFSVTLDGPLPRRPGDARRWVDERCSELSFECAGVDLPLLVSELVTNACLHGADPVTLRLEMSPTWARVEVEDAHPEWPELQWPDEQDTRGRGLQIVDLLSHVWGTEKTTVGKVVWAEVLMREPLERVGCT